MKKQMKRTVYEAPVTERFQVELEGAFMAASVVDENTSGVETSGHQINEVELSGKEWNDGAVGGDHGWQ